MHKARVRVELQRENTENVRTIERNKELMGLHMMDVQQIELHTL